MELPVNRFKRGLKHGKPQIGIWSSLELGYLFVAVGADTGLLARGSDALAAKFQVIGQA